ncbi:MAG TPA: hypothetical protein VGX91_13325 [Candidatus Cybelea sp.]|jgi:hypothetical protein|nr:hypothetical protein [Candidatus Cybelea sp.]
MVGKRAARAVACGLLLPSMLLVTSRAYAQEAYNWLKYSLGGYGTVDVGYLCDNGRLDVAVHGEANGSLSIALGDDTPKTASFDGKNAKSPDGDYYNEAILQKATECDDRGAWPLVRISSGGQNLNVRWQ